jgi:hypothetical protein
MTATSGTGAERSRLLLAIGAAAFSVIGVAVVMVAALVFLAMVATRGGGIGSVSPNLAVAVVTILMLVFTTTAAFVALRVFRMVRDGNAATE